ncbi:hypothetical protein BDZ91DRAFT_715462 [Kalaharituber pfeilii]|nr:hypothetical protein BDZ91DRAFT_715462 [Kalaharituber pfeilii]
MQHVNKEFLEHRMRSVEGHDDYIHLSGLLENPIFERLKPQPTQKSLLKALEIRKSTILQISSDSYHIRSTDPELTSKPKPKNAWDSSTIYIEPNILGVSSNPGKIARILKESNPAVNVEWVHIGNGSWAFVILSENNKEKDVEAFKNWPTDWIIMTKREWSRRDAIYKNLKDYCRKLTDHRGPYETISMHKQTTSALASSKQTEMTNTPYTPGLIVYLQNLHPESTKASIVSFLSRNVQIYLVKHLRNTANDGYRDNSQTTQQALTFEYVDYKPRCGFETAHVRLKSSEDAELLIRALEKRRRRMKSGDDTKGKKCRADHHKWVKGEILKGERERAYWAAISAAKRRK